MRSSGIGGRPRAALGESGARRATNQHPGTTASISARNLSRRVCFFLAPYSASAKLPCRCINWPPLTEPGRFYPIRRPERDYFSISLAVLCMIAIPNANAQPPGSVAVWFIFNDQTQEEEPRSINDPAVSANVNRLIKQACGQRLVDVRINTVTPPVINGTVVIFN